MPKPETGEDRRKAGSGVGDELHPHGESRPFWPGATLAIPNGKWTLLAFVASWNGPALHSIRELQRISDAHAAQGVTVVAVDVDDTPSGVLDFIKHGGGSFPVVFDEGRQISARLQPPSMPTFILLDSSGVVRHIERGYHGTLEADLDKALQGLL